MDESSLWHSYVALSDKLMTPNKYVEQINRLTMYMISEEDGLTKTQIFKRIAETHFDYNIKSQAEMYAEMIFPFYTFTMRNAEYWVNTVAERPWAAAMMSDIMTPVWNLDGYSQDEISRNRSLQYQVMTGNIAMGENMGPLSNTTLKLNPSFMDTYNIIMDLPHSTLSVLTGAPLSGSEFDVIKSRMLPPLQVLEEQGALAAGLYDSGTTTPGGQNTIWGNVIANLPMIGAAKTRFDSGKKYAERSGQEWQKAPLTQSTFGATQRWNTSNQATKDYYSSGSASGKTWDSYPRNAYPSNRLSRPQKHYYDSFYKKHYTKNRYF